MGSWPSESFSFVLVGWNRQFERPERASKLLCEGRNG
jgi:hypothetical protein